MGARLLVVVCSLFLISFAVCAFLSLVATEFASMYLVCWRLFAYVNLLSELGCLG